jgi:hypothetical protein
MAVWGRLIADAIPRISGAVQEGIMDPTASRRRRLQTEAMGLSVDQAKDELAHAGFGRAIKAGDLQAKLGNLALGQEQLGFDAYKHGVDTEQKGIQRSHEEGMLSRRALADNSPEALFTALDGASPYDALAAGDQARAQRSGRESAARTSADVSIRSKEKVNEGIRIKASEYVAAGMPAQEALNKARQEYGGTQYQRSGNTLSPDQRQKQKTQDVVLRIISNASANQLDPQKELSRLFGPEQGQLMWDTFKMNSAAGVAPGPTPAGPVLSTDDQMGVDILKASYGDDPSMWDTDRILQEAPDLAPLLERLFPG